MRIFLTGGTGNVGRETVRALLGAGHTVRVVGRRPDVTIEGAEYAVCDITDYGRLVDLMNGFEAVVHLAAVPSPRRGMDHELFRVNASGTFNVYQAAAENGIGRVVQASSINALGANYGVKPLPIRYLPIDEDHPTFTTDAYSFSKTVVEDIGAYFHRRRGISGTALRFPAVVEAGGRWSEHFTRMARAGHEAAERLRSADEGARRRFMAAVDANIERMRRMRIDGGHGHRVVRKESDPAVRAFTATLTDFFTVVDERDAAQSVLKSLSADLDGAYPLFVNDGRNVMSADGEVLAHLCFPGVKERRESLDGNTALVSIARARALIGYEPRYPVPGAAEG